MPETHFINVHLANVYSKPGEKSVKTYLTTMAWGDGVEVVKTTDSYVQIKMLHFEEEKDGSIKQVATDGYILAKKKDAVVKPIVDNPVLKVNFVDVQQGDAILIQSPEGKIILVDGGENQLFARYLAARFAGTSAANPQDIDCILVTHGDFDHFGGFMEIQKSETNPKDSKRLFIRPRRVYHNGLVKGPTTKNGTKVPDVDSFGTTAKVNGAPIITELEDDLLTVPAARMNNRFLSWKKVLAEYNARLVKAGEPGIDFQRLSFSSNGATPFDFFNTKECKIEVLGPFETNVGGKPGLKFLHQPKEGLQRIEKGEPAPDGAVSPSHTINGHSIVLRLSCGKFSFLLAGDLNREAADTLVEKHDKKDINLRAELLKTPHHGSSDFSTEFLSRVSPMVSIISSGDGEKEFIHPRATLVGALGRFSRLTEPLIFVTELVAFFKNEGWSQLEASAAAKKRGRFYGFSRTAYGIVKTRTDGNQLLVYTDSGKANLKEAYVFEVDGKGNYVPAKMVKV